VNPPALAVGAALLTGTIAASVSRLVVARLPEPRSTPEQPTAGKITYASLATARFTICCGVTGAAAALTSWLTLALHHQPAWSVLAVLGVVLAAVDLRTTWLPKILTWVAWGGMAIAVGVSPLLGGGFGNVGRATAGALVAGGLYGTLWLVSRGSLGFGDVRFAPLLGAATASVSWNLLLWALLLGSLAGAIYGVGRLLVGRRGPYPYAPPLLAGAYLALGAMSASLG
jgi:leader peptidase (prepilin peptidase)/N-methyltransferase